MRLWHATHGENISSILQNGLRASYDGYVYFFENPDNCFALMALHYGNEVKSVVIIPVDFEEHEIQESISFSEDVFGCKEFVYKGDLPKERVTLNCSEFIKINLARR